MSSNFGSLQEHYEALINEYRADLERNLDLAAGSAIDAPGAFDRVTRFLISEIARLKVQMIDIDLKVAKLSGGSLGSSFKASIEDIWPTMPSYSAGSTISIAAGVTTHGFHFAEIAGVGFVHRWAGPATRSGFVAIIDRTKPLLGEIQGVKLIDPAVQFEQVTVDGETTKFKWENESRLRFLIPALAESTAPQPTEISFVVNRSFVIGELKPETRDARRVTFNMSNVTLLENVALL